MADAPSESCDELPAVTLPCRCRVEHRRQLLQAFERGVGTVAFVAIDARLLLADFLAGLLVEHGARHFDRRDLAGEEAVLLRARDALLADEGVRPARRETL